MACSSLSIGVSTYLRTGLHADQRRGGAFRTHARRGKSYPSDELAAPPIIGLVSVLEHRRNTPEEVRCLVVTVSDTRTVESDASGRAIADLLEAAGHVVAGRQIVRDEPA